MNDVGNCATRLWHQKPKKGKHENSPLTQQPLGKNSVAKAPRQLATLLNLPRPELYTGHAFRRTHATVLADAGVSKENLKRSGRWTSDRCVEKYIAQSKKHKLHIAHALSFGDTTDRPGRPVSTSSSLDSERATSSTSASSRLEASPASLTTSTVTESSIVSTSSFRRSGAHCPESSAVNISIPEQVQNQVQTSSQVQSSMEQSPTSSPLTLHFTFNIGAKKK